MNELEKITYEVLVEKALYYFDSKKLVNWAVDVLMLGLESENLYILAGLDNDTTEEREKYFLKSLNDLKFEIKKSKKELVEIYAENIASKAIYGEIDIDIAFRQMTKVVGFFDYDGTCDNFYYIEDDIYNLEYEHFTMYCKGMTLENYKEYIVEEFKIFLEMQSLQIPNEERVKDYCLKCKKFTKPILKPQYRLFKKPFKVHVWCCEFCKSDNIKVAQDHFTKRLLIDKYK